ncbi:MAG TPA: TonB-dependent receptor plug domain-containing protein, partial [Steroidobacteraceae bacterium]|nr:TonB-dependent receptor plug domain-containing protein [Steroidobacteraceae bacterium]
MCSIFLCSAAGAQETRDTDARSLALEEVIVTAQKRDESLQEVPMAVTAFSAADLDRRAITSMADLDAAVPGLTVADNGLFDKVPTIRGVGNEAQRNRATTAAVAYHVDGVFLASTASSMQDYLDVERIEILRGPQGTVFGQNATGGVINVITRQPQLGEYSGYADVQGGSYELVRARAYGNMPLGDTVAARASVQYLKHDGYSDNITLPGAKLDDADNLTGRVQFLWQPSDTFGATVRAQYFDTDVGDRAQKNVLDPTADPRELRQDFPATFQFDSEIYSAELRWDWGWASLKSITSHQDDTTIHNRDADRSDGFYLPRMDGPFQ